MQAFENFLIVPPGSGIVHQVGYTTDFSVYSFVFVYFVYIFLSQVNLEYLARVVFNNGGLLYPDSLVGTDSHTTMINGLGGVL